MHLGLKQGEECGRGDKFFFLSQSKNQKEVWFTVSGPPPPPPPWHWGGGRGPLWFSRAILLLFLLWQTFFLKDTT